MPRGYAAAAEPTAPPDEPEPSDTAEASGRKEEPAPDVRPTLAAIDTKLAGTPSAGGA